MEKMKQTNSYSQNDLFKGALQTAFVGLASLGLAAADVPHIDTMASEWLVVDEIVHMPSLHNFHEMGACAPGLLGVNYRPGGQLYAGSGERWYRYNTLPLVKLMVNGETHKATHCQWFPHQAIRSRLIDDLEVTTTVRMAFEESGILYQVVVRNTSDKVRPLDIAFDLPGRLNNMEEGQVVVYQSSDRQEAMVHVPVNQPDQFLQKSEDRVSMGWSASLQAGQSVTYELVMANCSITEGEAAVSMLVQRALEWGSGFATEWSRIKTLWAARWADVFTPKNNHFSGHLPILVTDDEKIKEIYYRSILTLLCLHRTNLKMCDRSFITSGERAKGEVYFWDTSMFATVFALLEPKGMKRQLRLFLKCDPHGGPIYYMDTGSQFVGKTYGANDMTIFRLVAAYLAVTNDSEFLSERVGSKTVLEHMETLATNWRKLQRDAGIMLADYGENENILECAPDYIHRIPSLNSANVWMMRSVASLYEQQGNTDKSKHLKDLSRRMSDAVLSTYKTGDGVWYALHRDGKRVELRHCYDFACIGKFMTEDLSSEMKEEMVAFVEDELLTETWMRAMSLSDPAAAISDRPDHGPMGAFDAWPAFTAATMCRLGAWDSGIDFLRRTQAALHEGVYAQAREFYGPGRTRYNAPVRIAMRQGCMRECSGGGAFAEVIIDTLFGFLPKFGSANELYAPEKVRGDFRGMLLNVHRDGELFSIESSNAGLLMTLDEISKRFDLRDKE